MSQASKPVARFGRAAFELEQFEVVGGDRCVVRGRWFGVRGWRFMRPALVLTVDGQPTRLLADLADKPWAAEDGRQWMAAFPLALKRGRILAAELTVAPDLTIPLPAPKVSRVATKAKPSAAKGGPAQDPAPQAPDLVPRSEGANTGEALASVLRELAHAEAEHDRLQRELSGREAEKRRVADRMDDLLGQLSEAARERDEAKNARDQLRADLEALHLQHSDAEADLDTARRGRDEAAAERDAMRRALDGATQAAETAQVDRDRALSERGAAITAQNRAESERDAAVWALDQAAAERDGARALRDHALAERDTAEAARDEAVYQRDALSRTSQRLQSELAGLSSARGAAMVMRRAVQEPPAVRRHPAVLRGAFAIIVALVLVLILLIAVHGP